MTDARYESAQLTNDGAGRGWDFTPTARRRRYPINLIKACLALAAGCVVIAALWVKL